MAKINFKQKLVENLSLSDLMKNREKLETEQLIQLHPNGVTITDFDVCEITKNGKPEVVACYITAEEPRHFMFAGKILKDQFDEFIKAYDGDIDACRDDFRADGGIRVRLERSKTQAGNSITKVVAL